MNETEQDRQAAEVLAASRRISEQDAQPLSRVAPGEEFVGAGDEVVVLSPDGATLIARGVLGDAWSEGASERAAVRLSTGDGWLEVALHQVAHPDSAAGESVAP